MLCRLRWGAQMCGWGQPSLEQGTTPNGLSGPERRGSSLNRTESVLPLCVRQSQSLQSFVQHISSSMAGPPLAGHGPATDSDATFWNCFEFHCVK